VRVTGSSDGAMLNDGPVEHPSWGRPSRRCAASARLEVGEVRLGGVELQPELRRVADDEEGREQVRRVGQHLVARTSWPGLMFLSTTTPASGERRTYASPVLALAPVVELEARRRPVPLGQGAP
jgi:hypothetical protein